MTPPPPLTPPPTPGTARADRVVTLTLNPAVDVTYAVDALAVGETVRVRQVRSRSGGKGVNVAAVLAALGGAPLVLALTTTGPAGEFETGLDDLGLPHHLVPALPAVRRTVAVVGADGRTTSLQEPGHPADPGAGDAVCAALEDELARGAAVVVVSGSLPPGVPADLPVRLAGIGRAHGVRVVTDLSGDALRAVAAAGTVLTPNVDELADLTGRPPSDPPDLDEIAAAAADLLVRGAGAVLVTAGPAGVVAVTPDGAWHAAPVEVVTGNPTGAGDAAVAALAHHLAGPAPSWPAALADVVATSAACVLRPVAGEVDADARARWLPAVRVRALTHPPAGPPTGGERREETA